MNWDKLRLRQILKCLDSDLTQNTLEAYTLKSQNEFEITILRGMRMRRVVEEPIDQDRTELSSGAHEARGSIESWMLPTTVHHCFRTLPDTHNFTSQLYTYLIERCTTARYSASQLCAIAFHQNSAIALTTELWHCYTTELCRRCVPQNYLQPRLVARIMTQKYESYTGTVEFARTMHLK